MYSHICLSYGEEFAGQTSSHKGSASIKQISEVSDKASAPPAIFSYSQGHLSAPFFNVGGEGSQEGAAPYRGRDGE